MVNTAASDVSAGLDILLVEDNMADALMLSMLLKEHAPTCRVTVVRDGEEGVDYLFQRGAFEVCHRPDVVILDLNLPRKNGFEVLAETRANAALHTLPVFLFTTSASKEDAERARTYGVVSFMTKPADLGEFETMIARLVRDEFPRVLSRRQTPASV